MPLKADELVERIKRHQRSPEDTKAVGIVPGLKEPDLRRFGSSGKAAVDLRLGRWLLSLRQSRATLLEVQETGGKALRAAAQKQLRLLEQQGRTNIDLEDLRRALYLHELEETSNTAVRLAKYQFVPFGDRYILHPGQFILGITFEWLKFPDDLAGFVTGKSSWGRRGLIIETAAGIHPGFCGCLTLEIGNVGPVPIPLIPGVEICQSDIFRDRGWACWGCEEPVRRPSQTGAWRNRDRRDARKASAPTLMTVVLS
jgi:dCTP deaminase